VVIAVLFFLLSPFRITKRQNISRNPSPLPAQTPLDIRRVLWSFATTPKLPTVVSQGRLLLTSELAYRAIQDGIDGDFVETGVFTGGSTILLYKVLSTFDKPNDMSSKKKIFACDSFEGKLNLFIYLMS
jgi:hypothetical protein